MSAAASRPPEWEEVLLAAARLQGLLPGAVLVGGTAAALHAGHRFSRDADHVLLEFQIQLASPMPYDLDSEDLSEYRNLRDDLTKWEDVRKACVRLALVLFDEEG